MADEQQHPDVQPRPDSGPLAAGIAIIALGVLLFLDHAGIVDWGSRSGWWPIIAVIYGAARLAAGGRGVRSGVAWVLVGGWGLLNAYDVLQFDNSWPLLLVIAGGSMVWASFGSPREPRLSRSERRASRMERRSTGAPLIWIFIMFGFIVSLQGRFGARNNWNGPYGRRVTQTDTSDTVHRAAVMSEALSVSQSKQFHGGDLTAIMGQCDLDLTHAAVTPGETPVVNVFVLMGQVTLRVPDGWIVDTRAVPALGDVRDARAGQGAQGVSDATASTSRTRIVVRGAVTMGALVIKN